MAATLRGVSALLRPLVLLGKDKLAPVARVAPMATPPPLARLWTLQRLNAIQLQPLLGVATAPRLSILHQVVPLVPTVTLVPRRSLTYYSLKKGKRKSVKSVVARFLRLHCGLWLRRKAGYKKKLWKKSAARRNRLREHVFCNKTQCKKLDKMTTAFWKRRNWYLNDRYLKYHDRENLNV